MIPISDDNPVLRTPVVTHALVAINVLVWLFLEGAGFQPARLAQMVCDLGMVPGELTGRAPLGTSVPLGYGMACVVDNYAINALTPLTSMFIHGGWGHLLSNMLFLWVFGNNVEDSMGRVRFLAFYLICGLLAAAVHVMVDAASPVPTVGASGAISGVLGAYVVLYPRVHVRMLFLFVIVPVTFHVRAWVVLIFWFAWQVLSGLPQLMSVNPEVSSGVAVWAHVGGFVAGALLVRLFENPSLVQRRTQLAAARSAWHAR